MVDMHSHIIYGIDDGSKSKEMTLEMLKLSIECGVKKIVATPHYMKGRFNVEYSEVKDKVNELRQMVSEEKLDESDAAKIFVLKGEDVALVDGDVTNIKITYPYDLKLANTILNDKND